MSQVIEVRLINPMTAEVIFDHMTKASSHKEAFELALSAWSGGSGVLKHMELDRPGKWTPPAWKYVYNVTLADPATSSTSEEGSDRARAEGLALIAVLFAEYKERLQGEGGEEHRV